MQITKKDYYCPLCGSHRDIETNHTGEVYSGCKACGSLTMYCTEFDYSTLPYKEAIFHTYDFETSDPKQARAYTELWDKVLKKLGKVSNATGLFTLLGAERCYDGKTIKLYNPEQYPDQFVSSIGRVYLWKSYRFPNYHIETGYYLEMLETKPNA